MDDCELAREGVSEELARALHDFPILRDQRMMVTVSSQTNVIHDGPDNFQVRLFIFGPKFPMITVSRAAPSMYSALRAARKELAQRLTEMMTRNSAIQAKNLENPTK